MGVRCVCGEVWVCEYGCVSGCVVWCGCVRCGCVMCGCGEMWCGWGPTYNNYVWSSVYMCVYCTTEGTIVLNTTSEFCRQVGEDEKPGMGLCGSPIWTVGYNPWY